MAFCSEVRVLSSATWPAELLSRLCALETALLRSDFNAFEVCDPLLSLTAFSASSSFDSISLACLRVSLNFCVFDFRSSLDMSAVQEASVLTFCASVIA